MLIANEQVRRGFSFTVLQLFFLHQMISHDCVQIGSVIGKGGSRAKEIREQSGTLQTSLRSTLISPVFAGAFMNISAANEMHAYSPDRIVTVTGEPNQCCTALIR